MRIALLALVGLLSSCSKPASAPASEGPPPATPNLSERLAQEWAHRDRADPSTTKVIEALTAAGLPLTDQRQQSAASLGATYCVMLNSSEHVILSICEFPDPHRASEGAETSRRALQQIEGRTVDVKRSTVLAVIDSQANDASAAIRTKARAAFDAL